MPQTPCLAYQDGDLIDYTPSGAVIAGEVVLLGTIPCIAPVAIADSAKGNLAITGVYRVPQKAEIQTAGDAVYWDSSGDPYGGTAGTGAATAATASVYIMGVCAETTAATDTYVKVALSGAKRTATIGGAVTASDIEAEDATLNINGLDAAQGGTVAIAAGTSATSAYAGGAASVAGGVPGLTGAGGAASLTGGIGGATSGTGGAASIAGGAGTAGNANGGAVTVLAGNAHGSGTDGTLSLGTCYTSGLSVGATSVASAMPGCLTLGIGASTAAAGTTTADAGALPAATASVYPTTAANDTKGVVIHANDKVTGRTLFIGNGVLDKILKVYPVTGGTINGASANAAFSSVSGKGVTITCLSSGSNTWLAQ